MPRIVGVDVPKEKRVQIALTYIKGIGKYVSSEILKETNISFDLRAKDLTEEEISSITSLIQKKYKVEGELRRLVFQNIRRLMDIGSYRGTRHKRKLPVHGQRTHTNARTVKGPRKK